MMTFLAPERLLLLALVPAFTLLFLVRHLARVRSLQQIGDPQLIVMLTRRVNQRARLLKSILWLMALALLITALARPTSGYILEVVQPVGAEIVFVADVSLSMDATDLAPSRIERMKADVSSLLQNLTGYRFGIVAFAGIPLEVMPMTSDSVVTALFTNALSTRTIGIQGTALADALMTSLNLFDTSPATGAIVILMSDGENHEGDIDAALKALIEQDIQVFTIGYGTESGSTIPISDLLGVPTGFKTDASGAIVTTRLMTDMLQKIAETTSGAYLTLTTFADISAFAQALTATQTGKLTPQEIQRPQEVFSVFIALAWLFYALYLSISETKALST